MEDLVIGEVQGALEGLIYRWGRVEKRSLFRRLDCRMYVQVDRPQRLWQSRGGPATADQVSRRPAVTCC